MALITTMMLEVHLVESASSLKWHARTTVPCHCNDSAHTTEANHRTDCRGQVRHHATVASTSRTRRRVARRIGRALTVPVAGRRCDLQHAADWLDTVIRPMHIDEGEHDGMGHFV